MLISKYCLFVDFDAVQTIFFLNAHNYNIFFVQCICITISTCNSVMYKNEVNVTLTLNVKVKWAI